ncbi:hypothetical protein FRC03_005893, partial [Tulasnella sp. 419]
MSVNHVVSMTAEPESRSVALGRPAEAPVAPPTIVADRDSNIQASGGPSSLLGSADPQTIPHSDRPAVTASPTTPTTPPAPLHHPSGVAEAIHNVVSSTVQGRASDGPPPQPPPARRQPPRTVRQRVRFFFSSQNSEARKRIANVIRVCIGFLEVVTIAVLSILSAAKWKSKSDPSLSEWEACTNP